MKRAILKVLQRECMCVPLAGGIVRQTCSWSARAFAVLVVTCSSAWIWGQEVPPKVEPQPRPQDADVSGDELRRRLIREAGGDSSGDVMSDILRLMQESAQRLEVDFDAGPNTVEVQQRILENLDLAIAEAARRSRPPSAGAASASGDKRRRPEAKPPRKQDSKSGAAAQAISPADEAPPAVAPARVDLPSGELRELRAGWGNLPQREREEMVQGADEAYLDRYKAWIERYYRALQEEARSNATQP